MILHAVVCFFAVLKMTTSFTFGGYFCEA